MWRNLANDRDSLITQIKEANDIVDVVGSSITLRQAGSTFVALCPFHDDHNPSFRVDPKWQNYRCWACGKYGDVITFVQEFERVEFREALELLARRAGITLKKAADSPHQRGRALMLDVVRWAEDQYHRCLLESPLAEAARRYVGERGLTGDIVRRFGLGFAPPSGDWLEQRAAAAGLSFEVLENVGLIAARAEGRGHYDRFRDRVMFPIRDARGRAVGFGGRILPTSALSERAPKYYNSADTPLFTKSEHLYGLDQARQAATATGYLAVVEGYTDVLMAHQLGVPQVVSTMGTALNASHVRHLRRFVPRVVLVFDADAAGNMGVDRALEIFAGEEMDLAVATLPEGLDPCDLLVQQGPAAFRAALDAAEDVLDFKLNRVLAAEGATGIEGKRRAVDAVLGILALAPQRVGHALAVKHELMMTRIAQRLALQEETVWKRLMELRRGEEAKRRRGENRPVAVSSSPRDPASQKAPAAPEERELLEVLLADPALVATALKEVTPQDIAHPGLRQLLEGLFSLQADGETPTLDQLRPRLNNPRLESWALEHQEIGRKNQDRETWLRQVLAVFQQRRLLPEKVELQNQLQAAADHEAAVALLRQLQTRTTDLAPEPASGAGARH